MHAGWGVRSRGAWHWGWAVSRAFGKSFLESRAQVSAASAERTRVQVCLLAGLPGLSQGGRRPLLRGACAAFILPRNPSCGVWSRAWWRPGEAQHQCRRAWPAPALQSWAPAVTGTSHRVVGCPRGLLSPALVGSFRLPVRAPGSCPSSAAPPASLLPRLPASPRSPPPRGPFCSSDRLSFRDPLPPHSLLLPSYRPVLPLPDSSGLFPGAFERPPSSPPLSPPAGALLAPAVPSPGHLSPSPGGARSPRQVEVPERPGAGRCGLRAMHTDGLPNWVSPAWY